MHGNLCTALRRHHGTHKVRRPCRGGAVQAGCLSQPRGAVCVLSGYHPLIQYQSVGPVACAGPCRGSQGKRGLARSTTCSHEKTMTIGNKPATIRRLHRVDFRFSLPADFPRALARDLRPAPLGNDATGITAIRRSPDSTFRLRRGFWERSGFIWDVCRVRHLPRLAGRRSRKPRVTQGVLA